MFVLLTQAETAERLQCSVATVKRLRKAGKLSYLPGKPVLIDEQDVFRFLAEKAAKKEERAAKRRAAAAPISPQEWARRAIVLQRERQRWRWK